MALIPLLSIATFACSEAPAAVDFEPPEPVGLSDTWETADPASVGVDAPALALAVARASDAPRFRSLLAVKDGKLFLEEYFGGSGRDSLHDVRSVTKSIVSALAGIAIARGHLDLDATVADLLPPELGTVDPSKPAITVRHLLTMTSGFQWDEADGRGDYGVWIQSDDPIQFLLDRPIVHPPGSTFTYNSAAVHLLAVLIEEATGETLDAFAERELFAPVGIFDVAWEPMLPGRRNGASGIDLRARDLARLGQLFLQDGVSGGTRVLPSGWVAESTAPRFVWRAALGPLSRYTMGYLWWAADGDREPGFFAWGYGGQFIYVVPSLELVVVATTEWRLLSLEGGPAALEREVLEIIVDGIHEAADGR